MTAKEIEEAALKLPLDAREQLATKLMATVIHDAPADPSIEQEWIAEAERRLKAYEEGRMQAIPGVQVLQEIRKKLQ